jgi:hypothetical protein
MLAWSALKQGLNTRAPARCAAARMPNRGFGDFPIASFTHALLQVSAHRATISLDGNESFCVRISFAHVGRRPVQYHVCGIPNAQKSSRWCASILAVAGKGTAVGSAARRLLRAIRYM